MPGMADGGNNNAASRAAVKSRMISDSSFIFNRQSAMQ